MRQRGIWPEEQRQRYLLRHSKATERERVCARTGEQQGMAAPKEQDNRWHYQYIRKDDVVRRRTSFRR